MCNHFLLADIALGFRDSELVKGKNCQYKDSTVRFAQGNRQIQGKVGLA